jgi:hypothetical protein
LLLSFAGGTNWSYKTSVVALASNYAQGEGRKLTKRKSVEFSEGKITKIRSLPRLSQLDLNSETSDHTESELDHENLFDTALLPEEFNFGEEEEMGDLDRRLNQITTALERLATVAAADAPAAAAPTINVAKAKDFIDMKLVTSNKMGETQKFQAFCLSRQLAAQTNNNTQLSEPERAAQQYQIAHTVGLLQGGRRMAKHLVNNMQLTELGLPVQPLPPPPQRRAAPQALVPRGRGRGRRTGN